MADTNHRIFISYARKDGEFFAERICEEFDSFGITYWRDRNEMEGGRNWWQQIETNIEKAEYLVLLATKHALESATVRREWQFAREKGVCVFPVIVPTWDMPLPHWLPDSNLLPSEPLDFNQIPRWMSKLHFFNLAHEWETFIRYLQGPCNKSKVPFAAPELDPDKYVERSQILEKTLQTFFDPGRRQIAQVRNHAVHVALLGGGGFGKSTLAATICHNQEIKTSFIDGIVWVTLGEDPDILGALRKINSAFNPEATDFIDLEQGVQVLARLLQDRDCLIVLDDVWNQEHLRYFMQGGLNCSRLVTTRLLDVASQVDRHILVDEMTADESAQLLGTKLEGGSRGKIREITKRLGEWPLVLDLANGILRKRAMQTSADEALDYLLRRLEQSGVGGLRSRDADKRKQSIEGTLEVSLDQLQPHETQAFLELGVFPGDIEIPLSALGTLWGRDPMDTEELVSFFNDFSLLHSDPRTDTIRLHDVVREYLESRLSRAKGLHRRLIENWSDPHHLPNPYAWKWFSYHLAKADNRDVLHRLLLDRHWLAAKLQATDIAALLHDFSHADPQNESTRLVMAALRLSAHVLSRDPGQLIHQLRGRLLRFEHREIQDLIAEPADSEGLLLVSSSLPPPGGSLRFTFAGHTDRITAVAVSPDGQVIASGSHDTNVRLWNLEEGTERAVLHGHHTPIVGLVFDHTGLLWSASESGELIAWNIETKEMVRQFALSQDGLNSMTLTAGDQTGVTVADDLSLLFWSTETGEEGMRVLAHPQRILQVADIPGHHRVITASQDKSLRVWDVKTGMGFFALANHRDVVEAVAVHPEGTLAVSGSRDRSIKLWDLGTGQCLRTFHGHRDRISALAFAPDGKTFASASHDATLRIWDVDGERERVTLEGHMHRVSTVAFSPDGRYLISSSWDATLKVWDLTSDGVGLQHIGHQQGVTDLVACPDGHYFLSASQDRTVRVWDGASAHELKVLEGFSEHISALAVLDADIFVAAVGSPYSFQPAALQQWSISSGQIKTILGEHDDAIQAIAVGCDGKTLISTARDCKLSVWNMKESRQVCLLSEQLLDAQQILIQRDCRHVFTATWNTVQAWDIETKSLQFEIPAHEDGVTAMVLTPAGDELFTAGNDGYIRRWHPHNGESIGTFADDLFGVLDLLVTPNGRWIVTVGQDAGLRLWSRHTGKLHSRFMADNPLLHCAISPDGNFLAAAERSGRIHFLKLQEAGMVTA